MLCDWPFFVLLSDKLQFVVTSLWLRFRVSDKLKFVGQSAGDVGALQMLL